ncbi:MAG: hypothetical protein A2406_00275 [Candidatus Komeilibacteria bacterium RIFOXYC1_FULL_37_11]|uniref:DUF5671 domain-containing protein n=1 Tax=Candidatus Komeilibacteria bacterium RIFOXYC1_FULL_37_11 TaxID=1798555 RepID=A0A1G2BYM2_9BACT|nr:MAG: hypothetical protein A2406_00275 [Candidatus Komeilibacteria bacterium RIFOXYC1_FULL_37_11]OGY95238.1 MAG: hypothetical protein A2611_00840 [Candidatus Komeilibacteria bacterium RIFOXYD1_FULL_37_29]
MSKNDSAKYAFFYVLSLVALVFMSVSVGIIFFQIINKEIVDLINQYNGVYNDSAMKFAISAIIISAPIYYFTSRQIYKHLRQGTLSEEASVRKWFTYLILLVAIIVMIIWLITTINGFLSGELTTKAILKAVVALLISGITFSFYFYDIKRENIQGKKDKVLQIYFYGSLLVVLVAFAISIFVVDSPAETRKMKLDERVINSFYQIDSGVNNYYVKYSKMPESIVQIKEESNYLTDEEFKNPITNEVYEYKAIGEDEYQLCTTFQYSSKDRVAQPYDYYNADKMWLHDAGYQCLNQKVNPVLKNEPLPVK